MDTFDKRLLLMGALAIGTILIIMFGVLYDTTYIRPIASDNANNNCKVLGFDQYKTYSRVGLFSKIPVGIKCEYAEKYTDLGVRSNTQ